MQVATNLAGWHSKRTGGCRKEMVKKMSASSNKHLTLSDRIVIETGIRNGSSKTAIADTLGKNKSTIGREIAEHRQLKMKCALPAECAKYAKCKPGLRCTGTACKNYVPFVCKRRDRTPGACNGCERYNSCRFEKYWYEAAAAQKDYEKTLVDSRSGENLTTEEAKAIAAVVGPALKRGLSPYQILLDNDLGISERTLYNYIENGTLEQFGIIPLDLRRQTSRKITKKKSKEYKKRNDYSYLQNRKYEDYLAYMQVNPDVSVVQMDTVYNDVSKGPFIQTFKFLKYGFLFAVYHESREGKDMVHGVDVLEQVLGAELFRREVNVLLTDRGSEFTFADQFEQSSEGNLRTRVFYCDPMASCQKGSVENKHIELRYILPKGQDLYALGLVSQEKLNLVLSHVNSAPLEHFNGKSPLEVMEFLGSDVAKKFAEFGVVRKERDTVVLKPYLLNQ